MPPLSPLPLTSVVRPLLLLPLRGCDRLRYAVFFTKGGDIGESRCSIDIDICSVQSDPSSPRAARTADPALACAALMTSWATWIHAALMCACSIAEAMSGLGIFPKPWEFSVGNHTELMKSLRGNADEERMILHELMRGFLLEPVSDQAFAGFLKAVEPQDDVSAPANLAA